MDAVEVLSTTIPTFQVRDVGKSVAFYAEKLGFIARHTEDGSAIVHRDTAEIHLAVVADERWRERADLASRPVRSGAESYLAGTASCRIRVSGIDEIVAGLSQGGVAHPNGELNPEWWGDHDFSVVDLDGSLLTFFEPG